MPMTARRPRTATRPRVRLSEYTVDPASATTVQCRDQTITIPGLAVGDVILAIGPQGLTADVAFVPLRVAAEDTLPLRAFNSTGSGVNAASGTWTLINLGRAA